MKNADQSTLRASIDRLELVLRPTHSVNQAIDIGMAQEILLLHGVSQSDRGELKYRFSLRGASLLGNNFKERKSLFKLLKRLYDLRSRAVHSGHIEGVASERELIASGSNLAAEMARKIIEIGGFPDWEELILSANPTR